MTTNITEHTTSTDGTVYLHTHKADTAEQIAEALRPYIGRLASFYPPNMYGHINPHQSTRGYIRAIDGAKVTVYVPRTDYTGTVDAFEAFGSYCTTIHPKREDDPAATGRCDKHPQTCDTRPATDPGCDYHA